MNYNCYQLNLHNSYLAHKELLNKISQEKNYIAFIQELPLPKGKINFPSNSSKFQYCKTQRAALFIPSHLDFCQINSLTTPNSMAAWGKINGHSTLLVSLYNEPKSKTIPQVLKQAITYARTHNLPAIIAGDLNIHSQLWGSSPQKTNYLSTDMEELIIKNQIHVHNSTHSPTFRNSRNFTSYIDITLTFQFPQELEISDWSCHDNVENFSDHNTITFNVKNEIPYKPPSIRHWNKAKWEKFTNHLSQAQYNTPEIITQKVLDDMVNELYDNIYKALKITCPLKPLRPKKGNHEWTENLKQLRAQVSEAYKANKRSTNASTNNSYKKKRKEFQKACKLQQDHIDTNNTLQISSIQEASTYYKNLTQKTINIGVLQETTTSGTRETTPGIDTIKTLYKQHFPAHTAKKPTQYNHFKQIKTPDLIHMFREEMSITKIKRAFKGFDNKKSPGPDGLKPIILQHLPSNTLKFVLTIYKASTALHFTPTRWKDTKVIFIPKNDKPHYKIPKIFRPISLANYLLKAQERLLGWHMKKQLESHPIHKNQHGFCSDKGTESAISAVTSHIENHLLKNQHCVGVSLDIQAAFDSICPKSIKQALIKHGGHTDLIQWYFNYLTHRNIESELHNETFQASTGTGFPQGGVVSADFWKIVFDPALDIINKNGTSGYGYADDLIVLRGGTSIDKSISLLQSTINKLVKWGTGCQLKFNSEKTKVVIFHKKVFKHSINTPKILIDNKPAEFTDTIPYLGVTLDQSLTWKPHKENIIRNAKRNIMTVASKIKATCGIKPELARWLYCGIIRPKIAYAALVWAHTIKTKKDKDVLEKINRLAMLTFNPVRKTIATNSLEVIYDIMPLDIHLKHIAINTHRRLKHILDTHWAGTNSSGTKISHIQYWNQLTEQLELHYPDTDRCKLMKWTKNFNII